MLEQGTFFNRTADYIFMLAFGAVALLVRNQRDVNLSLLD